MLDMLRDDWSALLAAQPNAPIFLTWEWIRSWYQWREPEWEQWVLAVRNQEGELCGVVPLARTIHSVGLLPVKRLAFAGDHRAYRMHMDVIASPEDKPAIVQALLAFLWVNRRDWDVLDLEALVEDSNLARTVAERGWKCFEVERLVSPATALPDTWEAYERSRLSSDYRWQLRNRRKKLEKAYPGQVRFERLTDPARLPAAMEALRVLHQKRWHRKGQGSSFDHASFTNFHHEMARVGLERGWLRLYMIWVGERAIAAEYAYLYNGVLTGYATAFDMDFGDYNPGQILMAFMVQDAIAEGVRELDLGRGTFEYKFRWTDAERLDTHLVLAGTPAGYLWASGGALMRGAKAWSREKMPASLRDRINHRKAPGTPAPEKKAA